MKRPPNEVSPRQVLAEVASAVPGDPSFQESGLNGPPSQPDDTANHRLGRLEVTPARVEDRLLGQGSWA